MWESFVLAVVVALIYGTAEYLSIAINVPQLFFCLKHTSLPSDYSSVAICCQCPCVYIQVHPSIHVKADRSHMFGLLPLLLKKGFRREPW